jgi:uncharacterized membrane protein
MERALRLATAASALMLAAGLLLWLSGLAPATVLLHAGLWLLISTPVVRVLMALAGYLVERDWTFFMLCLVVLACLVFPLIRFAFQPR